MKCHPEVLFFGEPWFLIGEGGINDYLNGGGTAGQFAHAMLNNFLPRMVKKLEKRGYERAAAVYTTDAVAALCSETLEVSDRKDAAARAFIDRLFGMGLQAERKSAWVEKTPLTIVMVDTLYRLYPDMKYLHIFRRPAAVCASFLRQDWGMKSIDAFIERYKADMPRALRSQARVPREAYAVISLDWLVTNQQTACEKILGFTALKPTAEVLSAMIGIIKQDRAMSRRWQSELSTSDIRHLERECHPLYEQWVDLERRTLREWGL